MREKISVCITAGNEEKNIRRCLESVTWADEIIVIDSFSTDRTAEISRQYTELVYEHRWLGYIGQKNLAKDMASHRWILFIDADEAVSDELREEILENFNSGQTEFFSGFEFPRMVYFLGRWIRHGDWYPDYKLRLFDRTKGQCGGKEPHDRMLVEGSIKRLKAPLYHFTYDDISDQVATLNRFSTITSLTQQEEGRTFRLYDLLLRPAWRFFRGYIIKCGFMDGLPGYIVAKSQAYSVFIKYAKLWELQQQASSNTFQKNRTGEPAVNKDAENEPQTPPARKEPKPPATE